MKLLTLTHLLGRIGLFESFSPRELEQFLGQTRYTVESVPAGTLVAQRGDKYESLKILVQGSLRAEMPDPDGRILIVDHMSAPVCIASAVYFSRKPVFPVNLVTLKPSTIFGIGRATIFGLAASNRGFLESLLADMGDNLQFLAEKLRMSRFASLRQKLAVYLLRQDGAGAHRVELTRTQGELAGFFGVARPSLNRTLKQLEAEGLIRIGSGFPQVIEILDPPGLKALTGA